MATQLAHHKVPLEVGEVVTAAVVAGGDRMAFLGRLFGGFKHTVEARVHTTFEHVSPRTPSGVWQFVHLSNGGGYLRPLVTRCHVSTATQWTAWVSADVAGIVTTMIALDLLHKQLPAEGIFGLRLSQLRDFTRSHPDGALLAYLLMP